MILFYFHKTYHKWLMYMQLHWQRIIVATRGATARASSYISRLSVTTRAFMIRMSLAGLSWGVVGVLPMRWTIFIPLWTLPNIVCFPSNQGVGANVMKNCEPFELGPELAIHNTPAPVCFKSLVSSSSNLPPNILSPPLPVPVGSPPCTICISVGGVEVSKQHNK